MLYLINGERIASANFKTSINNVQVKRPISFYDNSKIIPGI